MSGVKVKFIQSGFEDIVTSPGVAALVEQTANDIKQRADANVAATPYAKAADGHVVSTHQGKAYGKPRALANVSTSGAACSSAEAVFKTLSSAVM